MKEKLASTKNNTYLKIFYGKPEQILPNVVEKLSVECIYASDDYEPQSLKRDLAVHQAISPHTPKLELIKNCVIFHRDDILKKDGKPYLVFTPYKRAWLAKVQDKDIRAFNVDKSKITKWPKLDEKEIVSIEDIGFTFNEGPFKGGSDEAKAMFKDFLKVIDYYKEKRDFPILEATSLLSIHIRFGTISIRELMRKAIKLKSDGAQTWVSELIWRRVLQNDSLQVPSCRR